METDGPSALCGGATGPETKRGNHGKKKRDEKKSKRRDEDAPEEAAPTDDARGPEGGDRDPGQKMKGKTYDKGTGSR